MGKRYGLIRAASNDPNDAWYDIVDHGDGEHADVVMARNVPYRHASYIVDALNEQEDRRAEANRPV
jgi:hypothetical protein